MEAKELMTKRRIEKLASAYKREGTSLIDKSLPHDIQYDVFVSHSSLDKDFIKKVLLFLKYAKGGVHGYVDWLDPDLSHQTNAATVKRLKERIRRSRKLIYVVTNDSLKSVWCSWELGYADCEKGVDNVAILAIKPNNGYWKNNEYLQQYPWITFDGNLFRVNFSDGLSVSLYEWLMK